MKRNLFLCKVPDSFVRPQTNLDVSKYLHMSAIQNITVNCPVRDLVMHANRRTDMKGKINVAVEVILEDRNSLSRERNISQLGVLQQGYNFRLPPGVFKNICSCHWQENLH
jgi:hypothetical protein